MKGLLARRELLKGMVEKDAMSRQTADKILAAERGSDRPKLEVQRGEDGADEIKLYDPIDSWGGVWGINAKEVADALADVEADRLSVRINSPGGDVFEGIAIHNLIADHPATVDVHVDSLAASIASVIAMAGDTITINRGGEMMIHNAWGVSVGDSADMRQYADLLERQSTKAAKIYAARAGGTVESWMEAMANETWYDADEAIDAGLAESKATLKGGEPNDKMSWDLTVFNYAGRAAAPDPQIQKNAATSGDSTSEDAPDVDETAATAGVESARQRAAQVVAEAKLALATSDLT